MLQKKGKKNIDTYENVFNQSLILLSQLFINIVLTSIPSINTKKRHPGCIRSFTGYPLTGVEDKSALTILPVLHIRLKVHMNHGTQ